MQIDINLKNKFSYEGIGKDNDVEEPKQYKLPKFRGKSEMSSPKLCLDLTFGSKEEFKEVIYNYTFANGKEIFFLMKNNKVRYIIVCNKHYCV